MTDSLLPVCTRAKVQDSPWIWLYKVFFLPFIERGSATQGGDLLSFANNVLLCVCNKTRSNAGISTFLQTGVMDTLWLYSPLPQGRAVREERAGIKGEKQSACTWL